jgi:hypothetical protein
MPYRMVTEGTKSKTFRVSNIGEKDCFLTDSLLSCRKSPLAGMKS